MGRYAFFNTGFEYKFAFAVQQSEDIMKFGGKGNIYGEDAPYHEWNAEKDMVFILNRLSDIESAYNYTRPDFEKFSKDTDGTYELGNSIYDLNKHISLCKEFYCYLLGCIIYHQLMYEPDLSATYEL